jgi:hypothetical protein
MSTRNTSPKQARHNTDTEILPTHSVSAAGAASNISALTLNETNTFSPSSSQASAQSPHQSTSPSRDKLTTLAVAAPPTIKKPSSALTEPLPPEVSLVIDLIEQDLGSGWILAEFKILIKEDKDIRY